jgi:hypothetical protein
MLVNRDEFKAPADSDRIVECQMSSSVFPERETSYRVAGI